MVMRTHLLVCLRLADMQSTDVDESLWVAPVRYKLIHVDVWVLPGIIQQQQRCQCYPVALHVVCAREFREESPEIWQLYNDARQLK